MPLPPLDEAEHLAQATHNEAVLDAIVKDVVPGYVRAFDWALVVMFYAAMHYASACLLRDTGECPDQHTSHYDRATNTRVLGLTDCVSRTYGPAVAPSYNVLFNRAWDARYRSLYMTQTHVPDALDLLTEHRKHLEIVKAAQPAPAA